MNDMLIGAIAVAALVIGLYFARFWKTTRDRFFLLFALAFWIEGADRVALWYWPSADEAAPIAYVPRLLAYILIIVAVIDKNRGKRGKGSGATPAGLDNVPRTR
ncbi:MAG TPA: DUF5985 family protein [Casimicrobiaceae bacterium]|nr:DUF5985 family protein [Casimicrobiaceae bacterium]